jgi:DNA-directed RNA polymerase specialized sigma24 family protein
MLDSAKLAHRKSEILVDVIPEPALVPETAGLDLSGLPEAQRNAIELRYEQDFSFEEIAARLETSSGNARQLVSRALRALREMYEKK